MNATVDTELALLLDVGSAWVKACAIGRTRGTWRLVGHVAQPRAWGGGALRRALIEQLEPVVDPRLVPRLDELVRGANRVECRTPDRTARIAVVAVSRELSGSTARRAAEAAGWEVVETVTLDDGRSLGERLAVLQAADVDAWLIGGGFDGSRSQRALEAAALVASARREGSGPVIWAGTTDLTADVAALFEEGATTAVANSRPDARHEDATALRDHLLGLLRTTLVGERETRLAPVALARAAGALAGTSGLRVVAVDVGARGSLIARAEPDGTVMSRVRARGGLAGTALTPGAAARVARLAGEAGDEAAVADVLQTLRARPATLPQTGDELAAIQAAATVALAALVEDGGPVGVDVLVGCGRTIAAAPHPAQAARMLLDGVRPVGVTQLALDTAGALGPLGSLPDDEIREGVMLLGDDLLVPLGTAVVTRGGQTGRTAMRVTVHRSGWPTSPTIEVRGGQLQIVPLPRGQDAELHIELGDGVSLGAPRRSPRITVAASGGGLGLVLDARGVPIALPRRADDRRAMLAAWREALAREASPGTELVA